MTVYLMTIPSAPQDCSWCWNREVILSVLNPTHLTQCLAHSIHSIKHLLSKWGNPGESVLKNKGAHFYQMSKDKHFVDFCINLLKTHCERKLIFDNEESNTWLSEVARYLQACLVLRTVTCSVWPVMWRSQLKQWQNVQQNLTPWTFSWPSRTCLTLHFLSTHHILAATL